MKVESRHEPDQTNPVTWGSRLWNIYQRLALVFVVAFAVAVTSATSFAQGAEKPNIFQLIWGSRWHLAVWAANKEPSI
jgi:hypothetical protein